MPPANDNLVNAEVFSGASGTTAGTIIGATVEAGDEAAYITGSVTVWYKFTGAIDKSTMLDITVTKTGGDAGFFPYCEFYIGATNESSFANLTYIDYWLGDGTGSPPTLNDVPVSPGQTVFGLINDYTWDGSRGNFDFSWVATESALIAGDFFSYAVNLTI